MCKTKWNLKWFSLKGSQRSGQPSPFSFRFSCTINNLSILALQNTGGIHQEVPLPPFGAAKLLHGWHQSSVCNLGFPQAARVCSWQMTQKELTDSQRWSENSLLQNEPEALCPPPWSALRSINPVNMPSILISNGTCLGSAVDGRLLTHLCHHLKH